MASPILEWGESAASRERSSQRAFEEALFPVGLDRQDQTKVNKFVKSMLTSSDGKKRGHNLLARLKRKMARIERDLEKAESRVQQQKQDLLERAELGFRIGDHWIPIQNAKIIRLAANAIAKEEVIETLGNDTTSETEEEEDGPVVKRSKISIQFGQKLQKTVEARKQSGLPSGPQA